jgi:signal transduction histidine kinase/CheY-like chemotaxis protein
LLVDSGGLIRRANPAALRTLGLAGENQGTSLGSLLVPEDQEVGDATLDRLRQSSAVPALFRFQSRHGTPAPFRVCAAPIARENQVYWLLQLFADTGGLSGLSFPAPAETVAEAAPTHLGGTAGASSPPAPPPQAPPQTVDASLAQKQKLDCALELARTVALDFNNALTSVLGHASHVLSQMEAGHPWRRSLLEIEKSAERAAEVVTDLISFGRQEKEPAEQETGNLNDLLRRAVDLFKNAAGAGQVEWLLALEPRLYSVQFDEAKMQQAFVKILENGLQAIHGAGRVQVQTRNLDLAAATQDGATQIAPGYYVCVQVEDTGEGIAPEVLPRIFEPFFTTKKAGPHRGLGLAWVYGIVTNHGGSVAVASRPGQGTAVRVYLPAQPKFVRDHTLEPGHLTGTQTVLVVDDEDLVLTMAETILSAYGYKVLTANNGPRALELVGQAPDRIDLVVTDMVMPNMSGRELIEHLRALAPHLRLICCSGYLRSAPPGGVLVLKKPFKGQDLLVKVKQALE